MELSALAEAPAARVRALDPDAALVATARANPREFLGLYDRYFDRVLGYARLRVADPATCEDVTSRVFTTVLEQLGRFRGEGTFAGWVFQIARNTVRDVHRATDGAARRGATGRGPYARGARARTRAGTGAPRPDPAAAARAPAPAGAPLRRRSWIRGDWRDRRRRSRDGACPDAPDPRRVTTEVSP